MRTIPTVQYSFSGLEEYKLIRRAVKDYIDMNLPKKDAFFTNIAINEAVNNAILHGKSSYITLILKIKDRKISIKLKNNGEGFNGNEEIQRIKNAKSDLFKENLYAEGNRGLLLMEEICDEIIYDEYGNEVLLVKEF